MADLENFGGGDFKHKTSKIRMSSPKLRVIFRPNSEIQTFFRPKSGALQKKKKRSSPKLRVIFRPKSEIQAFFRPNLGGLQKKKKKKVFTNIGSDFSAGFVRFRLVGRDASLTGAELFEIEADFSAKIVTFRLVGGGSIPPIPPPKSATAYKVKQQNEAKKNKNRIIISDERLRKDHWPFPGKSSGLFTEKVRSSSLQPLIFSNAFLN